MKIGYCVNSEVEIARLEKEVLVDKELVERDLVGIK